MKMRNTSKKPPLEHTPLATLESGLEDYPDQDIFEASPTEVRARLISLGLEPGGAAAKLKKISAGEEPSPSKETKPGMSLSSSSIFDVARARVRLGALAGSIVSRAEDAGQVLLQTPSRLQWGTAGALCIGVAIAIGVTQNRMVPLVSEEVGQSTFASLGSAPQRQSTVTVGERRPQIQLALHEVRDGSHLYDALVTDAKLPANRAMDAIEAARHDDLGFNPDAVQAGMKYSVTKIGDDAFRLALFPRLDMQVMIACVKNRCSAVADHVALNIVPESTVFEVRKNPFVDGQKSGVPAIVLTELAHTDAFDPTRLQQGSKITVRYTYRVNPLTGDREAPRLEDATCSASLSCSV